PPATPTASWCWTSTTSWTTTRRSSSSTRPRRSCRCSAPKPTTRGGSPTPRSAATAWRSEEHTSELQSRGNLVCRLLLDKKKYRVGGQGLEYEVYFTSSVCSTHSTFFNPYHRASRDCMLRSSRSVDGSQPMLT